MTPPLLSSLSSSFSLLSPVACRLSPDAFHSGGHDYARYRKGFPDSFFERLERYGIPMPGDRVLDLGTGTGSIARGLALHGAKVTGLDASAALIGEAEAFDREAGVEIEYVVGAAEATGLDDASYDGISAGQCWHWFMRGAAAAEARRLLAPGGWLVIAHFDWIPLPGNIVEATQMLVRKHNPQWTGWQLAGGTGIYPEWTVDIGREGFHRMEMFAYDEPMEYTHDGWRARVRASAGIGVSLTPAQVEAFDADLAAMLAGRFAQEPVSVLQRVFSLIGRKP